MRVECINKESVDFSRLLSDEKAKYSLWPVHFDPVRYHAARLAAVPEDQVVFFACVNSGVVQAVMEFQYNPYDTSLMGFTCGTVVNTYTDAGLEPGARLACLEALFRHLADFRRLEGVRFCLMAVGSWDTPQSLLAQEAGFRYILTWGKCFYSRDTGLKLPVGYRAVVMKDEAHLPGLIDMSQHYFRGGRFYLDPHMDDALTDRMYRDLVLNCFASPRFDFIVLLGPDERPLAASISRKDIYYFNVEFPVQVIRFIISDRNRLPSGLAAPFFSEISRLLSKKVQLIDSGIEMHNLASLKIHTDAGYKFNYIYSAYHSWV
jgi:hypothetical protein